LINFAYRLGSVVKHNDSDIATIDDVRKEAKLLMSLSYNSAASLEEEEDDDDEHHGAVQILPSTTSNDHSSSGGRITPLSVSSTSSSRRETFCFTCPSLSLEGRSTNDESNAVHNARVTNTRDQQETKSTSTTPRPGVMLGRTLKVDDKDAMRLSSEAMARNVMQSFQSAMEWRISSWVDSLSAVLVMKEQELLKTCDDHNKVIMDLVYSNEALLVAALEKIKSKIHVLETSTEFKVLHKISNAAIPSSGPAFKKQRLTEEQEDDDDRISLEEGEYIYDVIHVLEMQCSLVISTPAGHVNIDLNVPGRIKGSFLSSEDNCCEDLTDVQIQLNTDMLASMIEKSSRIAVRSSAAALLKGEYVVQEEEEQEPAATAPAAATAPQTTPIGNKANLPAPKTAFSFDSPCPTKQSPKRKLSDEEDQHPVSGLMVITPARDASSPSSYGDSDSEGDNKPVLLQIPDNFTSRRPSGSILSPQASRPSESDNLGFASRLPPKKSAPPPSALVTPMKKTAPEFECREQGPDLPTLVEVACAARDAKKN
jgi:hypothetical protein